jgi:hypothetical protein
MSKIDILIVRMPTHHIRMYINDKGSKVLKNDYYACQNNHLGTYML